MFHQAWRSLLRTLSADSKSLCIFCAGHYGFRCYYELWYRLVRVDFFADNNPNKQGLHDAPCLTFEELRARKDDVVVIAARDNTDAVVRQLKEADFPYLLRIQDLFDLFFEYPFVPELVAADVEDDEVDVDKRNRIFAEMTRKYLQDYSKGKK